MFLSKYNNLSGYVKRHYRSLFPFLNPHKAYNVLLTLSEMKLRRDYCRSRPFIFRIEPCSLCNLRCVSCGIYDVISDQKRLMDLSDFRTIVDKIEKHALRASLYDMGEPLLNKSIYDMTRYAFDSGISTLISTNFNVFKEQDVDRLLESRLTVLEPCLDGFTQENYVKYRRGGNVETVKNGIKTVMEHRSARRRKWPIVDVQVIMFDHIKEEIPLIEDFLKRCAVDKITYRRDCGSDSSAPAGADTAAGKNTCFWLYVAMSVRPDGSVYPCCGKGFDCLSYGNLLEQDLGEIWNNKYYRFSRALFSKGAELECDEEMLIVPCVGCRDFKQQRTVRKKVSGTSRIPTAPSKTPGRKGDPDRRR